MAEPTREQSDEQEQEGSHQPEERAATEAGAEDERKGFRWTKKELEILLRSLLDQNAGQQLMALSRKKNIGIFQKASERVNEAGYSRGPNQCRSKFKREKDKFFEMLEQPGGLPPVGACRRHFGLLQALWEQGGCPEWKKLSSDRTLRPQGPKQASPKVTKEPLPAEKEKGVTPADGGMVRSSGDSQASSTEESEEGEQEPLDPAGPSGAAQVAGDKMDEVLRQMAAMQLQHKRLCNEVKGMKLQNEMLCNEVKGMKLQNEMLCNEVKRDIEAFRPFVQMPPSPEGSSTEAPIMDPKSGP